MLLFKIEGKAVGPGEVSVMVFQRGESLGSLDVAIRTGRKKLPPLIPRLLRLCFSHHPARYRIFNY